MIFMRLKAFFYGSPLCSVVLPEPCTRRHTLSAREKSLEILRDGWELNPGHREDSEIH